MAAENNAADWEARLSRPSVGALYVHVPFCVQKCAYCDFPSWATHAGDPLMVAYVHALESQLAEASSLGLLDNCTTAYVGGGTPTLLGAEVLGGLVQAVRAAAPGVAELTSEANPDSLSDDVLAALAAEGATRLSIGVQSLNDAELVALGRVHDAQTARERVLAAVDTGLDVSVDLMCATPEQTDALWERTVTSAIELGVGHVSVYPLSIEDGTPLAERVGDSPCPWNDEDVQALRMTRACELLLQAGLERYEVASYAKPGHACAHNEAYWTGVPYLGLGTGASSMLTREGYELLCKACPQLPVAPEDARRVRLTVTTGRQELTVHSALAALSFDIEWLSEGQAAAEDLMLGARLVAGLDSGLIAHAREVLGVQVVDATLEGLIDDGFLMECAGSLAPTMRGWLLGNELYGRLWDLAPESVRVVHAGG